ncbi:MAG: C39 family peptidase [Chloroflexia bacterium]
MKSLISRNRYLIAVVTFPIAFLLGWVTSSTHAAQLASPFTSYKAMRPQSSAQAATPALVATPTSQATQISINPLMKVVVNGRTYDAYLKAATKKKQEYQYSCEFDAAWVVLKTYGFDVSVARQAEIVGMDKSRQPYYKETKQGAVIYGGNVTTAFSGDYKKNFLARSTGAAMRKVFEYYGLKVTPVNSRTGIEAALLRGELVWIKTTVDFKAWRPATWVMPDGRSYKTVLGNDHAAVVIGFNNTGVVIRDVLGPTSTNRQRRYEYEVTWPKFLAAWGAQQNDGLAVAPLSR